MSNEFLRIISTNYENSSCIRSIIHLLQCLSRIPCNLYESLCLSFMHLPKLALLPTECSSYIIFKEYRSPVSSKFRRFYKVLRPAQLSASRCSQHLKYIIHALSRQYLVEPFSAKSRRNTYINVDPSTEITLN